MPRSLQELGIREAIGKSDSRFDDSNVLSFRISNSLDKSVRSVALRCEYVNQDRSVVYAKGTIKFELPETVLPNRSSEVLTYKFYGSDFKDVTLYEGAELICNPVAVSGPSSSGPIYQTIFEGAYGTEQNLSEVQTELDEEKLQLNNLTSERDSLVNRRDSLISTQ